MKDWNITRFITIRNYREEQKCFGFKYETEEMSFSYTSKVEGKSGQ